MLVNAILVVLIAVLVVLIARTTIELFSESNPF